MTDHNISLYRGNHELSLYFIKVNKDTCRYEIYKPDVKTLDQSNDENTTYFIVRSRFTTNITDVDVNPKDGYFYFIKSTKGVVRKVLNHIKHKTNMVCTTSEKKDTEGNYQDVVTVSTSTGVQLTSEVVRSAIGLNTSAQNAKIKEGGRNKRRKTRRRKHKRVISNYRIRKSRKR